MPGMTNPTINAIGLGSAFYHRLTLEALVIIVAAMVLAALRYFLFGVFRTGEPVLAVRGGDGTETSHVLEPRARQIVRYAFGGLWILDGLLQLQRAMPAAMTSLVVQPTEVGQPSWVKAVISLGITEWSKHPIWVASGVVWVQLAIGAAILFIPSGWVARFAYVFTIGWALIVWTAGEGFGQAFSRGASWLFGAPGSVLFYAIAALLLLAPFTWWKWLPKWILSGMGVLMVGYGILEAWPGRGFWQGKIPSMISSMLTTPQFAILKDPLKAVLSLTGPHGGAVINAITVTVLIGVGISFVVRRGLSVTVPIFLVFSFLMWWIVQDFGILGGVGTDPNTAIPEMVLVIAAFVALRQPEPVQEIAESKSFWPETFGYAGRIFGIWVGIVALVGVGPLVYSMASTSYSSQLALDSSGQPFALNRPAVNFTLTDQYGKKVSLAQFAGDRIVLTNLDPVCTEDCPLIASELKVADQDLSPALRAKTVFIAVVANPIFHTVHDVDVFDAREGMSGLSNWYYLTSPNLSKLTAVWADYGWGVTLPVNGVMVIHPDFVDFITPQGVEKWMLPSTPSYARTMQDSFSSLTDSLIKTL